MKSTTEKRHMGQGPGDTRYKPPVLPRSGIGQAVPILPAMMYGNMPGIWSTRQANLNLGVQHYFWGLVK
jgi:hypothetical protein